MPVVADTTITPDHPALADTMPPAQIGQPNPRKRRTTGRSHARPGRTGTATSITTAEAATPARVPATRLHICRPAKAAPTVTPKLTRGDVEEISRRRR